MSCVSEARRAFRVSPQKSALCALQIGFFRFQSLFPDRAQAAQGTCNVLLAYGGTPCRLDNLAERGIIWLQAHKKVQCRTGCCHTRPLQRRSEPPSQPKARRIAFLLYRRNPVLYRGPAARWGRGAPVGAAYGCGIRTRRLLCCLRAGGRAVFVFPNMIEPAARLLCRRRVAAGGARFGPP